VSRRISVPPNRVSQIIQGKRTITGVTMFFNERERIAALAAATRLPAVYAFRDHVDAGGLISYGVDLAACFRSAAAYVVKILKG
jgi:ABC-type uncharacterized transport system substrate-binding protein